jgi:hypothetical protein
MCTWSLQKLRSPPNAQHDGGYVYICGGPYDAAEELRTEFEGLVPHDVIEELENELFSRYSETARTKGLSSRVNWARQLTPYYQERRAGVQNTSSDFTKDSMSFWCSGIPTTGML